MAKIDLATKEIRAWNIVHRCSFIETKRERDWMMNAIRSAFQWAERHSDRIDPDAPYAIVRTKHTPRSSNH